MYVKIMSDKHLALGADHRPYTVYSEVKNVHFERPVDPPCRAHIMFLDGGHISVMVFDHAYVMNWNGDTISHFNSYESEAEENAIQASWVEAQADDALAPQLEAGAGVVDDPDGQGIDKKVERPLDMDVDPYTP